MGSKLSEVNVLLWKEESSSGSDASPTQSANAIPIMEATQPEIDVKMIERGHPLHNRSRLKPLPGLKAMKMNYKTELYGSGAAGTAPRWGDILESMGFLETINAGVSAVYTPASSSYKTATGYQYMDGLLWKMFGAAANGKLSLKPGEPFVLEVESMGLYQDDADAAIPNSPSFGTNYANPPQAMGVTFSLDGNTDFELKELNLDFGIPIIPRISAAAAHGYAGFMVGKMSITGSLIIAAESKATYDFLAKFEAATTVSAYITAGSDAGNIIRVDLSLTYAQPKLEDADGQLVMNIPIHINYLSPSGDEISITQT